jgi:hypothetical protein
MRPPTQRPRWRCLDPGCEQHDWQFIPPGGDPLESGRRLIDEHITTVHDTECVLEAMK